MYVSNNCTVFPYRIFLCLVKFHPERAWELHVTLWMQLKSLNHGNYQFTMAYMIQPKYFIVTNNHNIQLLTAKYFADKRGEIDNRTIEERLRRFCSWIMKEVRPDEKKKTTQRFIKQWTYHLVTLCLSLLFKHDYCVIKIISWNQISYVITTLFLVLHIFYLITTNHWQHLSKSPWTIWSSFS